MRFGHHSTPSASQRRRNYATTNALTDYEADLTGKDRAKQKEAVKKYLGEKVKQDWTFEWPRPDTAPGADDPLHSQMNEGGDIHNGDPDDAQWRERDEWLSNASDSGDEKPIPATASSPDTPSTRHSPFRFETPDGVGDTVLKSQYERKRRRKKRLAEEMAWNKGLACFTARRDAWTGARRVTNSGLGALATHVPQRGSLSTEDGGSSTAIEHEEDEVWEDDIEVPIAPPILPPENAMRASILPGAYNTIYDKVVVQQLTPSCPMNLKDVTRSCVQGWKRDGEWPPTATAPEPKKKGRRMSVASLFGLDKPEKEKVAAADEKKGTGPSAGGGSGGIRKSLQKILSLGGHNKEEKPHVNPSAGGA